MKKYLGGTLLLLSLSFIVHAQDSSALRHQVGIDFSTFIVQGVGGEIDYDQLEVIYRQPISNGDLRFKLTLSNRNFPEEDLLLGGTLMDEAPVSLISFETKYEPSLSILASMGISKYFKQNQLPLYYGVDVTGGFIRGKTNTIVNQVTLNTSQQLSKESKSSNLGLIGLTPVLGMNIPITKRLSFGLEFGLEMNIFLGELELVNTNGNTDSYTLETFNLGLDRIINDILFLYKF